MIELGDPDKRNIVCFTDLLERIVALDIMVDTIMSTSDSADRDHLLAMSGFALSNNILLPRARK